MALPIRPNNPNTPIPNDPFYAPLNPYVTGPYYPITLDQNGVDMSTGTVPTLVNNVSAVVTAGTGISVVASGTDNLISNTGVISLVAGPNITLSGSSGVVTISAAGGPAGSVTSVGTGVGLTGGPITSSGTISLDVSGVAPGSYNYASITVDAYGRITTASSGTSPVTAITGTAPVQVTGTAPTLTVAVASASTAAQGVVQLNDTTTSTSTTQALTAAQGKNLQDQINALSASSNLTLAGTYDANTGFLLSVTTAGAAAGFTVGATLPAATAGNADLFVIVEVGGSVGPSGTPPYHIGDWFLSDGTTWQFLNVGYQAPYASTTVAGIVELATTAETQAGTDATLAVTPAGASASYVPKTAYTAKGTLLGASAANTPVALVPGTNGQILYACSSATSGLCWAAAPTTPNATPTVAGKVMGCTTGFAGGSNVSLGEMSQGDNITTGQENVAIGPTAAYWMSSGCGNVAVGATALFSTYGGTENCNTAIGYMSGSNAGGSKNSLLGACSGYRVGDNNVGGDNNTLVGYEAGCDITSGANNVAIGCGATVASATGSCQLAIGFALGQYWLTGTSTKAIKPGAGIIDCAGSCGTNGQVLMSNGSNAICWGAAPSAGIPCACITGKGALVTGTAASTPTALAVGANGQILYACSTAASGLCWAAAPASPSAATPTVAGIVLGCTLANNTALGCCALQAVPTGCFNTGVGANALTLTGAGNFNVGVGGFAVACNVTGCHNVGLGVNAARNALGSNNTVVGHNALFNATGGCNTVLGYQAGCNITTGGLNVIIGPEAQVASATGSCQLAIGFSLTDNWLTGTSTKAIKPGAGIIDCAGSCGTNGQVLMSNGSNAICWSAITQCTGTVTSVVAGTGLTGGTITTTGTIALGASGVTAGSVNYPSSITVDIYGRVTALGAASNPVTESDYQAKGDLIAGYGVNSYGVLTAGSDGQVLSACAACVSGLTWVTPASGGSPATPTVAGLLTGCADGVLSTTAVGNNALLSLTSGDSNTAIGLDAACSLTTGSDNTALGSSALCSVTTEGENTAVGARALILTSGGSNSSLGSRAGRCITTGYGNTAAGRSALEYTCGGNYNSGFGLSALRNACGSYNAAIGYQAGYKSDGDYNVFIGVDSGTQLLTGACNIFIGYNTGLSVTSGCDNVIIGPNVDPGADVSQCLLIGTGTYNWLSGDSTGAVKPGAGIIDCTNTCGTAGQVLQSTGSNSVVWATPAAGYAGYNGYKSSVTSGTKFNVTGYQGELGLNLGGQLNIFTTYDPGSTVFVPGSNALIFLNGYNGAGTSTIQAFNTSTGTFLVESVLYPAYTDITVTFTPTINTNQMNFYIRFLDALGNGSPGNGNFFSPFLTVF